jgi:AcrR family transcriptional regulator
MKARARSGDGAHARDVPPGLRERNKQKKRDAIVRAGRALFVQRGFEGTTTRAIAARAGVATGTFFLYFNEKRDLLFDVFKDDVSAVQDQAFATVPDDAPLPAQLRHVFGRFYAYYARDLRLSRVLMKELLLLEPGEGENVLELTMAFVTRIAELVAASSRRGEIDASADPTQVATHAFALYVFGVIGILNGAFPAPDAALAHVHGQLELLVRGLARRGGARPASISPRSRAW